MGVFSGKNGVEKRQGLPYVDIFYRFNFGEDKRLPIVLAELDKNLGLQQILNALYRLMGKGDVEDLKYIENIVRECLAKIGAFSGGEEEQKNINIWVTDLRQRVTAYAGLRGDVKQSQPMV